MAQRNFYLQWKVTKLWWSYTAASCRGPSVELMMADLDGFWNGSCFDILAVDFLPCTMHKDSFQIYCEFALARSPKKAINKARPFSSYTEPDHLFWLVLCFKSALKVLSTNLGLNKSLNVVLETNCFWDLGSLWGCGSSFQGDWQPTSVRDYHLRWRWEKCVAGCHSSVVARFAALSHEAAVLLKWSAGWLVTQAQWTEAWKVTLARKKWW